MNKVTHGVMLAALIVAAVAAQTGPAPPVDVDRDRKSVV